VRQVIVDPALAVEEQYDTLVVGHRWPSLTHGLVEDLHARGRRVLGVYDRDEPAGQDLLVAFGVDATVASDGGPGGIVAALRGLHERTTAPPTAPVATADPSLRRGIVTAVSGVAGAGVTEIAIGLAVAWRDSVLVDANDVAPSIAPRLGLAIEPNLRTAIDAVEYEREPPQAQLVTPRDAAVHVLAGLAAVGVWRQVRPPEVLRLVDRLAADAEHVVVEVAGTLEDLPVAMARPRHALSRAVIGAADRIVAVGAPAPAGIARLLGWIGQARSLAPHTPVHVVVNRAPKDAFRRGEILDEVRAAFGIASVGFVPADRRVEAAAWAGTVVARGPFARGVRRVAAVVDGRGAAGVARAAGAAA
jgi:MinD-like ATPase involved in chromosome partitioning or flagellar assembly